VLEKNVPLRGDFLKKGWKTIGGVKEAATARARERIPEW